MEKVCAISGQLFTIDEADFKFYEKIGVPTPTLCPDERARRRWAWRGKNMYLRTCDKCQKKVMAWYSPEIKTIQTYCEDCYRSDDFDATIYGQNFDFNRPFFEQFNETMLRVPRHISNSVQNENSEYIICAHKNKDCYFADEIDMSRDCYFGYNIQNCKNVVESLYVRDSEIAYSLIEAENCFNVHYSQNVFNCSDSAFLMNCRATKNSLFCTNLRNKEYHLFNQPVSKEEFQKSWDFIFSGSRENLEKCRFKFDEFLKTQIFPAGIMVNNEDCTGNYIFNSKNVKDSYCLDNCRDCRFCSDIHYSNDCYDVNIYEGDLMYECTHAGPKGYGQFFSQLGWFSKNLYYCIEMNSCENCFGCVGLKKRKYCILNKQYSKEEYEALVPKIIEHMSRAGEWGEFFPITMSPTPYNQTMAQRFFPITKDEALNRGWQWAAEDPGIVGVAESEIPLNLRQIDGDITKKLYRCAKTGKNFRFVDQEIRFYQKYGIPLPVLTPMERIESLWSKMGSRKLFSRNCTQCQADVQTTFTSAFSSTMFCEACYVPMLN